MKRFFLILALAAGFIAPSTSSRADEFSREYDPNGSSAPRWSVGVGLDYRLDDPEYNDYVPSECVRVFYALAPTVQLRLGLLHNSLTRLSSRTSFHTVAADLSVRFRLDNRRVTPFIESGFWMPYYWGVQYGREYDDYHPGIRVAAGLSVRLSRTVYVDMGVSQALNHMHTIDAVYAPVPMPPINGSYYPVRAPDGAYNETRFDAGVCFGL